MAYYHKLGNFPAKRHIQFRQEDGSLYQEELVSSYGFSGVYSLLYHKNPPTKVKEILDPIRHEVKIAKDYPLKQVHLNTSKIKKTGDDYLEGREMLMANDQVAMGLYIPENPSMDYFYKNGECDELLYIHDGEGYLLSQFGKLNFVQGDYVVIPRTTVFKLVITSKVTRILVIESKAPVETVDRYRNPFGQYEEHSPYCERDFKGPSEIVLDDSKGDFMIKIKKNNFIHRYVYDFSPLDVVGWDGYLYPYTFSIHDFEPITGRIHLPPPIHQTFQAKNAFVICSFVPRLFDYHPLSIPAPYNHSNIDSDEILYYAEGEFMSRKGIDRGSFTLHPGGLPHGPHPGTVEKSIGAKETLELAVMLDTFGPIYVTETGLKYIDENYPMSWKE